MEIYLTSAPTPSRVQGMLRLLLALGGREKRRRLSTFFHPPPLRSAETPAQDFEETLAALAELGLARIDGDEVNVWPEMPADPTRLFELLPHTLARVLLQPEINGQPNRFARAVGWFLAQPVGTIHAGYGAIKSALLAVRDKPGWDLQIDSDARLDMVISWAKYLGLLRQTREAKGEGLVPDPTPFLRRHLAELLPEDVPVPVQPFRERLGKLCPVLDGGLVRAHVLEAFGIDWPANRLSSALAFALRRLRRDRMLTLGDFNDARPENFLLLGAGERERITSVRRTSGGPGA